jgi:membrane-associated phospholipid phosphatase
MLLLLASALARRQRIGYNMAEPSASRPGVAGNSPGQQRDGKDGMGDLQIVRAAETLLGISTTLALVQVAVPGARPWSIILRTVAETVRSPRRLLYLAACCFVLLFNYLYLAWGVDEWCTQWVEEARNGKDFAHFIHRHVEGDLLARIQPEVAWLPATWFFGYVYVIVFPCLVFVSIFVFDHWRDVRGLAMVLIGYVANFLFVLPFYVCFPVRETFVYYEDMGTGGPAVRMLLDDINPVIMQAYRLMSGVDNCFPSFHTSLAVTLALVAWHGGRRFGLLITSFAAANVLATMYLGVHWVTDVAAGLVVGVGAYWLARRLSARWAGGGGSGGAACLNGR